MGVFGENYKGYVDKFWYDAPDCVGPYEEGYRRIIEELFQLIDYPLELSSLICEKVDNGIEITVIINGLEAKSIVDGSEYFNGELLIPINEVLKIIRPEDKRRLYYLAPVDYDVFVCYTTFEIIEKMVEEKVIWCNEKYFDFLSKV